MAREFMSRGSFDGLARYEHGDALDAIERYDGPFDVMLLDHQNERYQDGFEAIRDKLPPAASSSRTTSSRQGTLISMTCSRLSRGSI